MKSLFVLLVILTAAALQPLYAVGDYSAELIHFTHDGTAEGDSLFPGFGHHSCWNGIGISDSGNIYVAISNHLQPRSEGQPYGNAALCMFDPLAGTLGVVGDLESASRAAGNWQDGESQHKVHTFILQHADGKMYFATMDYYPSYYLRGTHLYTLDPAAGNVMTDFSATAPYVMKRDFSVIPNAGGLSDTSGVFAQYYGMKGLTLNKNVPDLMYAMLFARPTGIDEPGYVIKYDKATGAMEKIGESNGVSYRMYTDNDGNLYYCHMNGNAADLLKYTLATDSVTVVAAGFASSVLGGLAPTASGDSVYMSTAEGEVFRLDCTTDSLAPLGNICGGFAWIHTNLSLAPDGKNLYYVIIQGNKGVFKMSTRTGVCEKVFDIAGVVGDRTLSFDGVNIWDRMGRLYIPIWDGDYSPHDIALLKLELNQTTDYNGFIAHPRVQEKNSSIAFRVHANDGVTSWHWDFGDGSEETATRHLTSHTYTETGLYTVTLTTTGSEGTKVYRRKEYIQIDPESFSFEAEGMDLAGKYVIDEDPKAGGTWIKIDGTGETNQDGLTGTATGVFEGPAGAYDIRLLAVPENDGPSTVDLDLNGTELGSWVFTSDPMYFSLSNRDTFWVHGQELAPGDTLVLTGYSNRGAYARFDRIDFLPLNVSRVALLPETAALPNLTMYPLPAKGRLAFNVTDREAWDITILDTRGNVVRTLERSGCSWDGRDEAGLRAASGLYILRVNGTGGETLQPFMFME